MAEESVRRRAAAGRARPLARAVQRTRRADHNSDAGVARDRLPRARALGPARHPREGGMLADRGVLLDAGRIALARRVTAPSQRQRTADSGVRLTGRGALAADIRQGWKRSAFGMFGPTIRLDARREPPNRGRFRVRASLEAISQKPVSRMTADAPLPACSWSPLRPAAACLSSRAGTARRRCRGYRSRRAPSRPARSRRRTRSSCRPAAVRGRRRSAAH